MLNGTLSPCKDCGERHSGCHAECKNFLAWKEDYNKRKEEICKQRDKQRLLDDMRHDSAKKMMRKYGMKGKDKLW